MEADGAAEAAARATNGDVIVVGVLRWKRGGGRGRASFSSRPEHNAPSRLGKTPPHRKTVYYDVRSFVDLQMMTCTLDIKDIENVTQEKLKKKKKTKKRAGDQRFHTHPIFF